MFIIILKKTIDLFLVVDPTNLKINSVTKNAPEKVKKIYWNAIFVHIYYVVYKLI